MQREWRELRLEIEVASEPISGRMRMGDDQTAFTGWLQLLSLLELLRTPTEAENPETTQEETC